MQVELDKKLVKRVARCLGTKQDKVIPQAPLLDLARGEGWRVGYLFREIKNVFGIKISPEQRRTIQSVEQLAIAVDSLPRSVTI